jgi:hypothetical protein
VQGGDMLAANNIFETGSDELKKYYAKYLVRQEGSRFVELVNGVDKNIKEWMLRILLVYADQPLINEVFRALKPSNDLLNRVAYSAELACMPQRFSYFLGKITSGEEQDWIVMNGVRALVDYNKTECLNPLLTALDKGTFMNPELENVAIRCAFWASSFYQNGRALFVKRFFDYPAVSAVRYSSALYNSYWNRHQDTSLFYWLLKNADYQDLQAAKDKEYFTGQQLEFQNAVDKALRGVGPDPRPRITLKRIETIEALKDVLSDDVLNIVDGYIEWHVVDPDMRFGMIHQKRNALLRKTLAKYIPQNSITIIVDY